IRQALTGDGDLGRLGIGWLLVEHRTPGPAARLRHSGLEAVFDGPWLTLYRLTGNIQPYHRAGPPRAAVRAADAAALALVGYCLLWLRLPAGKLSPVQRNPVRE